MCSACKITVQAAPSSRKRVVLGCGEGSGGEEETGFSRAPCVRAFSLSLARALFVQARVCLFLFI
jgi:hypothetical protein